MSEAMVASRPVARDCVPMPVGELFEIVNESIEAGRLDRAERLLGHVFAVAPNAPDALHMQGMIAYRRKHVDEAAALMERGVAAGGRRAGQLRNLSEVYRYLGRLDEALTVARQALASEPADPLGPFNLAMVHYDRAELQPCIAAALHAVQLRPNLPQAHMKLGQAYLMSGDFARGWNHYEWRYQIPGATPLMPPTERKQWDGRDLPEGRLLLIADQGFGDVLMFARYVEWARVKAPDIIIACSKEMAAILTRMFPGISVFTRWDVLPDYLVYCAFSGLPRLHGTTLDTIPGGAPYLTADPSRVADWAARLAALLPAGLRRVGIAWAGRPSHNNDHSRSVGLRELGGLAEIPGVVFVALQKGAAAAQMANWPGPAPLVDLGPQLADFEDTAAVISQLDLVVTVDTAVAHLGGALGVPTWVMLPYAADWRWLRDRTDSPWYSGMRLFRPPATRRWNVVVTDVAAALEERFTT